MEQQGELEPALEVAQDLELDSEQVALEQDLALVELVQDFSLVGELVPV